MRVLVIEDDTTLGHALREFLGDQGYAVDWLTDGDQVASALVGQSYDLLVLDLNLPGLSGLDLLRQLRAEGNQVPVLILTARDGLDDRVAGLDAGADDYVTKPFHMEEVLARVRALIRRAAGHASSELFCGPLRLDTKASKADIDGVPLKLTSHEYRMLAYLMHHKGSVVSRTELVEHLYDQDFDRDSNTIEVFVGRLRKKLGVDLIETVRGMGYRMREPNDG